jgi:hypothetical protein
MQRGKGKQSARIVKPELKVVDALPVPVGQVKEVLEMQEPGV